MASIKGKNTAFELGFLKLLSSELYPRGYRYRKHYRAAFGNPDIAFVGPKIVVFLDSDFWHGHDFKKLKPQLKNAYWVNKIKRNIKRDQLVNDTLRKSGWRVLRFGEAQLKKNPMAVVRRIERGLKR